MNKCGITWSPFQKLNSRAALLQYTTMQWTQHYKYTHTYAYTLIISLF